MNMGFIDTQINNFNDLNKTILNTDTISDLRKASKKALKIKNNIIK